MDVYDRPQRRLFQHAHISGGSKIPPVSVAGSVVPVPVSPVWVVGSAQGLHKAVAPSDRSSEEAGVQVVDLSGRYYLAEPTEGPARTGAGLDPVVAATVGLHKQLGQVSPVTISAGGLSGVSDRLDQDDISPSTAEDNSHSGGVPESSAVRRCLGQAVGQADRETDSLGVGHTTSAAALSPVANGAVQSSALWASELRDNSAIDSGVQRGAPLVVAEPGGMQWSQYNNPDGRSRNNHRLVLPGSGCRVSGVDNSGPVDREPAACECLGTAGNRFCSPGLGSHIHIRTDNTTAMAQINMMGGTRSARLLQVCQGLWNFCLESSNILTAGHIPGAENAIANFHSRQFQDRSDWRLLTEIFQQISRSLGPVEVDLFSNRLNAQLEKYVSWKPDPFALATDAFLLNWKGLKGYAWRRSGRRGQP